MYPGEHEVGIHSLIVEKNVISVDWDGFASQTGQHSHHTAGLKALKDGHSCRGATSNHIKEHLGFEFSGQSLIVLFEGG